MNLPNILTVARIFLTFFFAAELLSSGFTSKLTAGFIFLIASLTDWFDGYYARRHNLITDFGKLMDPIADKFLVLTAFFVFAKLQVIPWWMVIVIAAREIYITALRLKAMRRGKVLAAEKAGKYKTILQMVTILAILMLIIGRESFVKGNTNQEIIWLKMITILMYAIVGLTVYSGILFLWHNRTIKNVR